MIKKIAIFLPLFVTILLGGLMFKGLIVQKKVQNQIVSIPIDKPFPDFNLEPMPGFEKGLSKQDLMGRVSLINIWGSWCVTCEYEHPILLELAAKTDIPILGINWREDKPEDGPRWLARKGNPYQQVGTDPLSKLAITLGVTGAPETIITDKRGNMRWRHAGPLDWDILNKELLPLIRQLQEMP